MNKYRIVDLEGFAQVVRAPEKLNGSMTGGIVLSKSPQEIDNTQSPDSDRIRVNKGGAHQDYGVEVMGSSPSLKIQALGEHRFVLSSGDVFSKIFRAYRQADTYIMIESWENDAWTTEHDSTSLVLEDVRVDVASYFAKCFFADGERVIVWDQTNSLNAQADNFNTGNTLDAPGETANATISPGDAYENKYTAHYKITVTGPSVGGASVTIKLKHDGEYFASETHFLEESGLTTRVLVLIPLSLQGEKAIGNTEVLYLEYYSVNMMGGYLRTNTLSQDTGTPLWKGSKTPTREGIADVYLFTFILVGTGLSNVQFYTNDGGGWDVEDTQELEAGTWEWPITKDGLGAGAQFGLHVSSGTLAISAAWVEWNEGFDVVVHGFNQTDDSLDGVTYQTIGTPVNTVEQLDKDPGAGTDLAVGRYLGIFANRLLILQDDGDVQKIAWSVSGDPEDFVGDGYGETALEGRGDPVDELMYFRPLASDVGALFRKRSIMRVVPTGQTDPALAFLSWFDNLGTESPFSVTGVPGGLFFLGHDRMVYYLTEGGIQPVGADIQDELEHSVGDLSAVEGTFDPVSKNYILAVPGDSGSSTKIGWMLNFQRLTSGENARWQRHTRTMNLLTVVGDDKIVFTTDDNYVKAFDRTTVIDGAYWTSPMLNRANPMGDYTLSEVAVRYASEGATSLTVQGSGDGGETWEDGEQTSLSLVETDGKVVRVFQSLNVTGPDLRFRVGLPSDYKVILYGWQAKLIDRSELESDS